MKRLLHLSFEASGRCNLASAHTWCPAHFRGVISTITPEQVIAAIAEAEEMGFRGWVGFHYYNEPLLSLPFIEEVMNRSDYPRFMLWTNGTLLTKKIAARFGWVVVTAYGRPPRIKHPHLTVFPCAPDERLRNYESGNRTGPCWRPSVELAFDCAGQAHLCCQDWRGDTSIGSITDFRATAIRFLAHATSCAQGRCPAVCASCHGAQSAEFYASAMRGVRW
jgi:hypothetical protein